MKSKKPSTTPLSCTESHLKRWLSIVQVSLQWCSNYNFYLKPNPFICKRTVTATLKRHGFLSDQHTTGLIIARQLALINHGCSSISTYHCRMHINRWRLRSDATLWRWIFLCEVSPFFGNRLDKLTSDAMKRGMSLVKKVEI